ncbi:huntingtin-interacting protein M-like [Myotis daubentonii]|uniref:huntingtin-interacting protein M-like n=1 Tax=Myotis daubentonii TaxID=98922 RepID=UPI002873424E|nr:huntingtin-interacting protein M-like [Myotis daubentonii]XP_059536190.1 huntingtin-interacting protein M-like [Myotis daubentonii]XP_059536191.1 huntingtin-interacting protein M-like [Myotis daubentonii]XP_059536192.1 huntingtin-interacting protein M-like [Myotis daubentonii]XP_059536193.1 huntingtin-interacting protein M-like [Myotis daubentonii]XP_059536194.1 huntingtin-interacting protein M-like [Myotis daubentonii]
MSQNQSPANSTKTPDHDLTAELQSPLTYVDRLLQNNQQNQDQSSGANDLVMVMLDSLTDYIVEMVGMEVNNQRAASAASAPSAPSVRSAPTAQPEAERAANSHEVPPRYRDAAFTLFDPKRASRRG